MHVLGPILSKCPAGTALFAGISAASALTTLRTMLTAIGVKDAASYGTHDFRRGHALDLQLAGECLCCAPSGVACGRFVAGAPLYEILPAGEWRSPAFVEYLDYWRLEAAVVVQAHLEESEDENAAV